MLFRGRSYRYWELTIHSDGTYRILSHKGICVLDSINKYDDWIIGCNLPELILSDKQEEKVIRFINKMCFLWA